MRSVLQDQNDLSQMIHLVKSQLRHPAQMYTNVTSVVQSEQGVGCV